MDRKCFLKRMAQAGMVCCGAAWAQEPGGEDWVADLERRMIKGSETPGWVKAEKAEFWIKEMMTHMDELLDPETKVKLMQACGRSCYNRASGVAGERKPGPEQVEAYLQHLSQNTEEFTRGDGQASFKFGWGRDHQNPWGLILRDGYCMCPLVESGPAGLSPTFCYCSTGYVREIFERATGKSVTVELLESLKMGGRDCVFRITIQDV